MQNLRPRIIIEGTELAGTKEIALALSKHPRIVGKNWESCFTTVISAQWCSYTKLPWGEKMIDFSPDEEDQAMQDYRIWVGLIERQRHTGWIVDRFHLSTLKHQLLYYQAEHDFDWLEERLKPLCFHQVLVTQTPEAIHAAIRVRATSSAPSARLADFESVVREQQLLRQIAAASTLPTVELEVSENDAQQTADRIADWITAVGGNIPPADYALDRVILPAVC